MNESEIHKTLGLILGKLDGIYHQLAASADRHEGNERKLAEIEHQHDRRISAVEKKVYIGTGLALAVSAFMSQFKGFFH